MLGLPDRAHKVGRRNQPSMARLYQSGPCPIGRAVRTA